MEIREHLQEQTIFDLSRKLAIYGKCALIRCMGFGKTKIMAEIASRYKRVLFLYPTRYSREEIQAHLEHTDGVDFMTYKMLTQTESLPDYDLICLDEVHRCGARHTKEAVRSLMSSQKAYFIGATGTPDRMDSFDVIKEFFDNICVYEYTLHDAFVDGIVKRPYYCFCTYDLETDLKQEALTAGEDPNDPRVKEVLDAKLIEWADLVDIPDVIKNTMEECCGTSNYMKFIVFFSCFKQLHEKAPEVEGWFQEAFLMHEVRSITVTSETPEYTNNLELLKDLEPEDNTVDLIFCVDMLSMSAHLDNLTGIVMYRGTSSSAVFMQQLGRALSAGSDKPGIVFDIVDNLHRKSIFRLEGENRKKSRVGNENNGAEWWHDMDVLSEDDVRPTGFEATYRELLAKAVAEPIANRCRIVLNLHRKLMDKAGKEYSTREELSKDEPLMKLAKWQEVTVKQVLDMLFPEAV